MPTPVDIAPARGKLGVLLVGLGAVSTTFIAGVIAIRKGIAKPIGSLTQMGICLLVDTSSAEIGFVLLGDGGLTADDTADGADLARDELGDAHLGERGERRCSDGLGRTGGGRAARRSSSSTACGRGAVLQDDVRRRDGVVRGGRDIAEGCGASSTHGCAACAACAALRTGISTTWSAASSTTTSRNGYISILIF